MINRKIRKSCRIFPIFITLALLTGVVSAQIPGDTIWTHVYGMNEHDVGHAVRQTSDGGFILCGLGVVPNYNLYDFLLIKTDAAGNQVWAKYFGGPYVDVAEDVQQTNDGGYVVVGYTSVILNEYDIWLLKTDPNGDTVWAQTYGGANSDYGHSVKQTADGGYIVCGDNQGSGQAHYNAYLVKTYANGNVQWDQEYGGNQTDEFAYCATQTSDGGFILAGKTNASGDQDIYAVKTNFSGAVEWENTYGGSGDDVARSVIENSDGDFIIAGETFSFGGGMRDYVLKVGPGGGLKWERNYGITTSQRVSEVAETIDGGYALFGGLGPYPANDVYVLRIDSAGTIIWERNYGRVDRPDYGWGGCIADDTVFMAIGETKSFDETGEYDFWLLAINSGLQGEPRGACCDSAAGTCEDNILQSQCSARFAPDTLCADLDPPCPVGGGCDEDEFLVKIMTDNFPEETTWEITDANFVVVGSGGPYPGQNNTLIVDTVCVDSLGCYNFVIFDSGGNGIVPGGYYELYLNSALIGADYNFDGDSSFISYVGDDCGGLGACCDDSLDECGMYVGLFDCQGPNKRFAEFGLCEDFDPPCGGCPEDMFEIFVMTDSFPEETSWVMRDSQDSIVAQGGPYTGSPTTLFSYTVCVDSSDCYSFTLYDAYGDGLFPPAYFEIRLNDSLLVHNNTACADSFTVSHLGSGCGPVTGACCDDSTADCNENIEEQNCQGSSMRFLADGQCGDFNPPCGGCSEDEILIEIMPDYYPLEITWALTISGTSYVVAIGGPLHAYNTFYRYSYCASADSCYDFYIFDDYEDGICCDFGIGYYRIYLNGALVDSGGQYGAVDTVTEIGNGCGVSGCDYVTGDVNNSGSFNGLDVTYGVAYFKGGPVPPYECECTPGDTWYVAGDVNGSCNYNGLDITYAVAYFKGGASPFPCPDCPPNPAVSSSSGTQKMIEEYLENTETRNNMKKERR